MKVHNPKLEYAAYGLLCLIWGTTWMAIRVVVRDVPPLHAAALRFVIAAALLLVVALAKKYPLPKAGADWRSIFLLSITMMALPYGLIFWAEQFVNSSMTAVLYSTSPLMVALLTPLLISHRVPRAAIYSLLVAVGGIAYLFNVDLRVTANTTLGGMMVLVAVLSSSFSSIFAKRHSSHLNPVVSTGLQLAIGSIFLFGFSFAMERGQSSNWNLTATLALIFLGTFGSAIAFVVYYWLLRHMHPYKLSTVNLVVPFVAIAVGALILQELITLHMFMAAVVVLGAVGFVLRAESEEVTELKIQSV